MGIAPRTASICLVALALGFGAISLSSTSFASPGGTSLQSHSLGPRGIPFPPPLPPRFQIPKINLGALTGPVERPPVGLAIDFAKLFGKSDVSRQERAVASAACKAMNLVYLGTGQHAYWEEAIHAEVPADEYEAGPFATALINTAVDRAANSISAIEYGPTFSNFYFSTCYQKKFG